MASRPILPVFIGGPMSGKPVPPTKRDDVLQVPITEPDGAPFDHEAIYPESHETWKIATYRTTPIHFIGAPEFLVWAHEGMPTSRVVELAARTVVERALRPDQEETTRA